MIYLVFTTFFVIYLELLGMAFANKYQTHKMPFNFGLGFIAVNAYMYFFTLVITALNLSFNFLFIVTTVLFLASLWFIIKNVEFKKLHFDGFYWIILLAMTLVMLMYSYNTAMGELNGFDTTHYLNMVTGNIGAEQLNAKDVVFGDTGFNLSKQYTGQSYYYLASVILFVMGKIASIMHFEFYVVIGYIWIFQIIFSLLLSSIVIIALKYLFKENFWVSLLFITINTFIIGKLYYNNIFGFFGNSQRTIILAYASFFLYCYFKNRNEKDFDLFGMSLLAACSTSSSAVFMVFFHSVRLIFCGIQTK